MIIVEGPDGAGKSTLIEHLEREFRSLERGPKFSPPSGRECPTEEDCNATVEWYTRVLLERTPIEHWTTIFDRFFISEIVYGSAVRGKIAFSFSGFRLYVQALDLCLPMIVYCRPPLTVIESNVMNSEHMEGVEDNLLGIVRRYDDTMQLMARMLDDGVILQYDYTDPDYLGMVTQAVKQYLAVRSTWEG